MTTTQKIRAAESLLRTSLDQLPDAADLAAVTIRAAKVCYVLDPEDGDDDTTFAKWLLTWAEKDPIYLVDDLEHWLRRAMTEGEWIAEALARAEDVSRHDVEAFLSAQPRMRLALTQL